MNESSPIINEQEGSSSSYEHRLPNVWQSRRKNFQKSLYYNTKIDGRQGINLFNKNPARDHHLLMPVINWSDQLTSSNTSIPSSLISSNHDYHNHPIRKFSNNMTLFPNNNNNNNNNNMINWNQMKNYRQFHNPYFIRLDNHHQGLYGQRKSPSMLLNHQRSSTMVINRLHDYYDQQPKCSTFYPAYYNHVKTNGVGRQPPTSAKINHDFWWNNPHYHAQRFYSNPAFYPMAYYTTPPPPPPPAAAPMQLFRAKTKSSKRSTVHLNKKLKKKSISLTAAYVPNDLYGSRCELLPTTTLNANKHYHHHNGHLVMLMLVCTVITIGIVMGLILAITATT